MIEALAWLGGFVVGFGVAGLIVAWPFLKFATRPSKKALPAYMRMSLRKWWREMDIPTEDQIESDRPYSAATTLAALEHRVLSPDTVWDHYSGCRTCYYLKEQERAEREREKQARHTLKAHITKMEAKKRQREMFKAAGVVRRYKHGGEEFEVHVYE